MRPPSKAKSGNNGGGKKESKEKSGRKNEVEPSSLDLTNVTITTDGRESPAPK